MLLLAAWSLVLPHTIYVPICDGVGTRKPEANDNGYFIYKLFIMNNLVPVVGLGLCKRDFQDKIARICWGFNTFMELCFSLFHPILLAIVLTQKMVDRKKSERRRYIVDFRFNRRAGGSNSSSKSICRTCAFIASASLTSPAWRYIFSDCWRGFSSNWHPASPA